MSVVRPPAAELADIARQARSLLSRVRESRWPGLAPAHAPEAPRPAALPRRAQTAPVPRAAPPPTGAPPGAQEQPRWRSLVEVAGAISLCEKCPLHATRTRTVPGEGSATARLLFVGEAPGADEDAQGRPFVGAAGQLLDRMIGAMGLSRGEVFIANVLKCRPPGNRDPQPQEVASCLPYLQAQIDLIRPEAICTLGKHAAHALLGRTDPIGRLRGRFFDLRGTPLLPTFHPSYLLRSPGEKVRAWKDLQTLMQRLGLTLPGQQEKDGGRR